MRTVRFPDLALQPAAEKPRKEAASLEKAEKPFNPLDALADVGRELSLLGEKFKGLILARDQRHGDLQVMLSAAKRIEDRLKALIEAEESRT